MPRGRMLNKKISQDEKVARLSLEATLLYTWTIAFLDYRGRIYGDLWTLKSIVPHIKEITPRKISKIITEWVVNDLVIYYGNEKQKYLEFKGFLRNQTLREGREAESEIPAPTPAELQQNSELMTAKVKISKVKISKVSNEPSAEPFREPTKEEKEAMAQIHNILIKDGFNFYTFMRRCRKQLGYFPPCWTVIKIGETAVKNRPPNLWGYFVKALKNELPQEWAKKNIEESEKFKVQPEILKGLIDEILEGKC